MTLGGLAYGVILLAMFYTPTWKAALSSGGVTVESMATTPTPTADTEETREAA